MSTALRAVASTLVLCSVALLAPRARADEPAPEPGKEPTKEECIAANESAQTLRQTLKLQAAHAQLLVCLAKTCPAVVRDDCAERLSDLERAMPTVVFVAKGTAGVDLTAVGVSMDGVRLADHLDGSALGVDPGEHTFEFVAEGYPSLTKKLLLREGVKSRIENVAFAPTDLPPPSPDHQELDDKVQGRRTLAYAVGGAGIVGLGLGVFFGLRAKSTYDEALGKCPGGPTTCGTEAISGGDDARQQATISTIGFVAGGLLVAGGVVLYLTAPKKTAVRLAPSVGAASGGLRFEGGW